MCRQYGSEEVVQLLSLRAAGLGEGSGAPKINGLYHLSNRGSIFGGGVGPCSQACQMLQEQTLLQIYISSGV